MKKIIILLILIIINLSVLCGWELVSNMPHPVFGGEAVIHESLIYIIGGYSDSLFQALDLIQVYNPEEDHWSMSSKKLKLGRYGHVSGKHSDNIIVFGGGMDSSNLNFGIESWDYDTEFIEYDSNYTFNRIFSTAVFNGDDIYIFGGYPNNYVTYPDSSLPYMVKYNISTRVVTDSFSINSNYPDDLPCEQMSAPINGNIFIFGGLFNGVLSDIYRYNISEGSFNMIGSLLEPRSAGKAICCSNGYIFLIGGYNESYDVLPSVEVYQYPMMNSFIQETHPLLYGRAELMSVLYDNYIYVFGGKDEENRSVKYVEKIHINELISGVTATIDNHHKESVPGGFHLSNYPNPFNSSTLISFNNRKKNFIKLNIYSITGKLVKSIINKELSEGTYRFTWDGTDHQSLAVSSGIYICKISTNFNSESKRLLLLR